MNFGVCVFDVSCGTLVSTRFNLKKERVILMKKQEPTYNMRVSAKTFELVKKNAEEKEWTYTQVLDYLISSEGVEELHAKLEELKAENAKLNQKLEEKINYYEGLISKYQQEKKDWQEQNTKLIQELKETQTQNGRQSQKLEEATNKIMSYEQKIKQLQADNERLNLEVRKREEEIAIPYKQEIKRLNETIKSYGGELSLESKFLNDVLYYARGRKGEVHVKIKEIFKDIFGKPPYYD